MIFVLALMALADPNPASMLLPPGTRSLDFSLRTTEPASCGYSIGAALEYAGMIPFRDGQGETSHRTRFTGLDPDTSRVNEVYVRCSHAPEEVLHLRYRSLPSTDAPFPRAGNLWGTGQILPRGLPHAARIGLHLGANFKPDQIRQLRALNPNILILTSINTVENSNLPDDFYLKDISGKRIEVWPNIYRLNLTKPKVAEYQARFAYERILKLDLMVDGCFFDNFMTTMSWLRQDIHGNRVQLDTDEDGRPDDPKTLDAAWRAGVYNELRAWRKLMPHALASGHMSRPPEPEMMGIFNGDSIGFVTARVLEGENSFVDLWDVYQQWFQRGRKTVLMMIESAPHNQIAYGYDYRPLEKIPPPTLEFARTYFPYVRFGLALTLMNDGYFAHEFGDMWHGNDWWYDELDFNLGRALGPARRVVPGPRTPPNLLPQGKLNQAVKLTPGVRYDLSFRARSRAPREILVSARGSSRRFYTSRRFPVGTEWGVFGFAFEATVPETRIEVQPGADSDQLSVVNARLVEREPDVWRRDFTHGIALLNGTSQRQTIQLEAGLRRIKGEQAPRHEFIVDDLTPGFRTLGAWRETAYDSGPWKSKGPFFHHWGKHCHQLDGEGSAEWKIPAPADDTYTLSAWWAAAPESRGWAARAVFEVLNNGKVVASATLDQTRAGDQWHEIAQAPLSVAGAPVVRVRNAGPGSLIADAIYVRSASRYNDGSAARQVVLEPLDGVLLERTRPAR